MNVRYSSVTPALYLTQLQGREIRKGGTLVYVDSPAVRAVKHGRLLILEGIEKAERGIMPVSAVHLPISSNR